MTDEGPRLEALLRAVPFFAELNRVDLARLVGALEAESHPAKTVIFKEAEGADALYLVERGRVRVSVRATGRERTIAQLAEGAHFGELGLLLAPHGLRHRADRRDAEEAAARAVRGARAGVPDARARNGGGAGQAGGSTLARVRGRSAFHLGDEPWETNPLATERTKPGRSMWRTLEILAISVAVPLLLWWTPPPAGLRQEGWRVILVVIGVALAWLFEPLPDFIVTLLMAAAWGVAGLAPLSSIFAGFASPAWVLGLGALTLAAAMVRTGLMFRASLAVLRLFPDTHRGQVLALLTGGLVIPPWCRSPSGESRPSPLSPSSRGGWGFAIEASAPRRLSACRHGWWGSSCW